MSGSTDFIRLLIVIFGRYLILAGIAFIIYYLVYRRKFSFKKIQVNFPKREDYFREIAYSVSTAFIFALIGWLLFFTPFREVTRLYLSISDYGWTYFVISIPLMLLIHDTYFYWTHRWMHRPEVFRYFHKVHHLSTNPSPWAAMAFHPLEAVVEAGVIVMIALLIPVHPIALGIFLLLMMIYNVYGHLGYELYPKGFHSSVAGRWINTSLHHNRHHEFFKGNYGLYFLWWDRWMGTLRKD